MVGNNSLTVNTVTMIQIVQQWINRTFKENPPKAVDVKGGNTHDATFEIKLSDADGQSSDSR